jgi:hypothetical protein
MTPQTTPHKFCFSVAVAAWLRFRQTAGRTAEDAAREVAEILHFAQDE